MTKLEKFLLASASEMIRSETTNSRYFIIENISIRLSDHISFKTTSDIQIIVPTNEISGLYTVIFGDSGKLLIWNHKQLKEFLPSMILIKDMNTKSIFKPDTNKSKSVIEKIDLAKQDNPKIEKSNLVFNGIHESKLKVKTLSALERNIVNKQKSTWVVNEVSALAQLFRREFGRGDSINEDFQIFLNCTALSYNEVLNIYKIVVVDNNKTPTIELLQEAYTLIK